VLILELDQLDSWGILSIVLRRFLGLLLRSHLLHLELLLCHLTILARLLRLAGIGELRKHSVWLLNGFLSRICQMGLWSETWKLIV
jgi:hypothetical protein